MKGPCSPERAEVALPLPRFTGTSVPCGVSPRRGLPLRPHLCSPCRFQSPRCRQRCRGLTSWPRPGAPQDLPTTRDAELCA